MSRTASGVVVPANRPGATAPDSRGRLSAPVLDVLVVDVGHSGSEFRFPGRADLVTLVQPVQGEVLLGQGARTSVMAEGQLALRDGAAPLTLSGTSFGAQADTSRCRLVRVSRQALGLSDRRLAAVTEAGCSATTGVAALLGWMLAEMPAAAAGVRPDIGEQLTGVLLDLLTAFVDEHIPAGDESVRALMLRVVEYINRHLTDPDLSPERIAAAHHISLRHLHRTFEQHGSSVSRLIQQRRLEESARALARATREHTSVAAVGRQWGFPNASHFGRAFRSAYGVSPRAWHQSHACA